ncbi:unnamed protein product [Urochloa humidicola]
MSQWPPAVRHPFLNHKDAGQVLDSFPLRRQAQVQGQRLQSAKAISLLAFSFKLLPTHIKSLFINMATANEVKSALAQIFNHRSASDPAPCHLAVLKLTCLRIPCRLPPPCSPLASQTFGPRRHQSSLHHAQSVPWAMVHGTEESLGYKAMGHGCSGGGSLHGSFFYLD